MLELSLGDVCDTNVCKTIGGVIQGHIYYTDVCLFLRLQISAYFVSLIVFMSVSALV